MEKTKEVLHTRGLKELVGIEYQKLVEENKRLIDSNRELIAALAWCKSFFISTDSQSYFNGIQKEGNIYNEIETAINNAKNILP